MSDILLSLCEELQQYQREAGAGDPEQRFNAQARRGPSTPFKATMRAHVSVQESALFPLLIGSMAGSDAVCLRNITDELCAEHRAIELLWARVTSTAGTAALDAEALVALCERHLAFERDELWPMAERLLSNEELARISSLAAQSCGTV